MLARRELGCLRVIGVETQIIKPELIPTALLWLNNNRQIPLSTLLQTKPFTAGPESNCQCWRWLDGILLLCHESSCLTVVQVLAFPQVWPSTCYKQKQFSCLSNSRPQTLSSCCGLAEIPWHISAEMPGQRAWCCMLHNPNAVVALNVVLPGPEGGTRSARSEIPESEP